MRCKICKETGVAVDVNDVCAACCREGKGRIDPPKTSTRLQDALLITGIAVMPYSGRGMMGKNCLAITAEYKNCQHAICQAIRQEISDLVQLARDAKTPAEDEAVIARQGEIEEMIEQSSQYKQDTMGYDVVLYWPDIPYDESEDH